METPRIYSIYITFANINDQTAMLDHKFTVFYHLAKNPNTTKVADELCLSQPAISKSIKELERELSITLFDREKGRMRLTEAGNYLLAAIEPFIQKEREVLFEIGKLRNIFSGILRIGASTTLSQYVLPELLSRFVHTYPGINIQLSSGNTDQIEREILANNLHLAFIEGTPTHPDIRYIPFIKDEIVLVCSTDNPVTEQITKKEFQKLSFVFREKGSGTYNIIRRQLLRADIDINEINHQLILGSTEGIKQYLRYSKDCFALLSIYSIREELAAGKLKVVEIDNLPIERTFYAIHRQGEPDLYARKFLDFSKKGFSGMGLEWV